MKHFIKFFQKDAKLNSLIDNKKGDISVALYTLAPSLVGCCNHKSMIELASLVKLKDEWF